MKPILPKTSVRGLGIPQIHGLVASPGTTIILASPLASSITLGVQRVPRASPAPPPSIQGVPQPTPVILPLSGKPGSSGDPRPRCPPLLVPKKGGTRAENRQSPGKPTKGKIGQKCTSKQSKPQHNAKCDAKQAGHPETSMKSILPKVPQGEAQTLILIPAPKPVVSSLILTSKGPPENAKAPRGQKKFEGKKKKKNAVSKENEMSLSHGPSQEPDVKAASISICASESKSKDKKTKRKKVSKLALAAEDSSTRDQSTKKTCHKYSGRSARVPTEHQDLSVPSKCASSHSLDLSSQQGVPHHPPPPYPEHANTETCLSLKELQMPDDQETDKTVKETLWPKPAGQKSSQVTKKLCELRHRRLTHESSKSFDMASSENVTDAYTCSGSNTSESQVSSSHLSCHSFPSNSSKVYPSHSTPSSSTQVTSKLIEASQSFPSDVVVETSSCSSQNLSTYSQASLLKSAKDPSSDVVPSSQPALNASSIEGAGYSSNSSHKTHHYSSVYSSSPSLHSPPGTSSSPLPNPSSSTGFMHSPSSVCYSQNSSPYSNMSTSVHSHQPLPVSDTPAVASSSQSCHQSIPYSYHSKPTSYTISAQSSSTQNSETDPCIPPLHTFYSRTPEPSLGVHSQHSTLPDASSHPSNAYAQQPPYEQSPQTYAHSPQKTYAQVPHYGQSPQPPSYTQSSYPASFAEPAQPYTESHPNLIQSGALCHHSPSYGQSPQPDLYGHSRPARPYYQTAEGESYPHSPKTKHDPQLPLLSQYSNPPVSPPSSHYYSSPPGPSYASLYGSQHAHEVGSSFVSLGRSPSPPSYEAHLQSAASYLNPDAHLPDVHYGPPLGHQTTPANYSTSRLGGPSERPDPGKGVGSPPAYPSSALFPPPPPPPPRYTSNPKVTLEACPKESPHAFYPSTPPAACHSAESHSSLQDYSPGCNHGAASLNGIYLQEGHCGCDDRTCKSMDHQGLYRHLEEDELASPSCRSPARGGSHETLKVHSLIERAERLWFIPHQEQNRVYMKRKELARDFLTHPNLHSSRNMMLKEKFWIEEDEPIDEEILLSSLMSNPETDEQKEGTAKEASDIAVNDSQQQELVANGLISKKKQTREMLCQVCGKMLKGFSSLRSHLNSHGNVQPHACPYCSKGFTTRGVLVAHLRIHTGETPYPCGSCGASFRTRSGLRQHGSTHTDARPYECSACPKAFKTKPVLRRHAQCHPGGASACPECGKTFERRRSMAVHRASHRHRSHRFPCPHCSKGYHFRSLLGRHMRVHSGARGHVCPACGRGFAWRSGLAAHAKTHSASRPRCDVCGARFASGKRLEAHRRRHSDPRPHKCGVCDKGFSHAYRLASHSLTHQAHKEHSCPKCNSVLSSAKKLRKHVTACHRKEEARICQLSGTVEIAKSSPQKIV